MSSSSVRDAPGGASPVSGGSVRGRRGTSAPRSRPAASAAGTVALIGRGGIVVMFGAGVVFGLLARWLGMPVLAGAGLAAGCALAAVATRPAHLLTLVVRPPLVFRGPAVAVAAAPARGRGPLLRGV